MVTCEIKKKTMSIEYNNAIIINFDIISFLSNATHSPYFGMETSQKENSRIKKNYPNNNKKTWFPVKCWLDVFIFCSLFTHEYVWTVMIWPRTTVERSKWYWMSLKKRKELKGELNWARICDHQLNHCRKIDWTHTHTQANSDIPIHIVYTHNLRTRTEYESSVHSMHSRFFISRKMITSVNL